MRISLRPARAVGLLAVLAMAAACSDMPISPPADDTLDPLAALLSEGTCPSDPWEEGVAYDRSDRVSHENHEWRAKKPSLGIRPGSHPAYWGDLGACAGDPGGGEPPPVDPTPIQIFGVWHAGNDYTKWGEERDMGRFAEANNWIIDRDPGPELGAPSVNLVVLSFVNPLDLLTMGSVDDPLRGIPPGMTQAVVEYFKKAGIRVMLSIGGLTYIDDWNAALDKGPTQLGLNAAAVATKLQVGIEIDYEENRDPNLAGLQAFVDAYRSVHKYDASGSNHAARLTIDLAAGGRYLQALNRYASENWLGYSGPPVLDYANAMVTRSSGTPDQWQEHVDGKLHYAPPILPKAPSRFTGGLYLKGDHANCNDFEASEQAAYADYVQTVLPNGAGTTPGMLGFMFWAAEAPSSRGKYTPTTPPNTCEGGMGAAATVFEIPIPMPPLRQN